jgi:hypothetical protein
MLPYICPEFIEVLLSRATDESAIDTSVEAPQDSEARKGQDRIVPLRHVTFWTLSRIVALITLACVICLIIYLILVYM